MSASVTPEISGQNNRSLRESNRNLIVKLIAQNRKISRVELAKQTGLTKMTITNIISDLFDRNFLLESPETEPYIGAGRRPIALSISEDVPCVLGVCLMRESCQIMVADFNLDSIYEDSFLLEEDESNSKLERKLRTAVQKAIRNCGRKLFAVGVGTIGPMDRKSGTILNPVNFKKIHDFNIRQLLEKITGLPVYMDSAMSLAALAEHLYGTGHLYRNFMYLGAEKNIGSGCILHSQLLMDEFGISSGIGHTAIELNGRPCICGNQGCLEAYVSIPVLEEEIQQEFGAKMRWREALETYIGTPMLDTLLSNTCSILSSALVNAVNLMSLDAIYLGGEYYFIPEHFLQQMEEEVNHRILASGHRSVKILLSAFGDKATLYGSAAQVYDKIFRGEINLFSVI